MSTCGVCLREFDQTINRRQWLGHDPCIELQSISEMKTQMDALDQDLSSAEHQVIHLDDIVNDLRDINKGLEKQLQATAEAKEDE